MSIHLQFSLLLTKMIHLNLKFLILDQIRHLIIRQNGPVSRILFLPFILLQLLSSNVLFNKMSFVTSDKKRDENNINKRKYVDRNLLLLRRDWLNNNQTLLLSEKHICNSRVYCEIDEISCERFRFALTNSSTQQTNVLTISYICILSDVVYFLFSLFCK